MRFPNSCIFSALQVLKMAGHPALHGKRNKSAIPWTEHDPGSLVCPACLERFGSSSLFCYPIPASSRFSGPKSLLPRHFPAPGLSPVVHRSTPRGLGQPAARFCTLSRNEAILVTGWSSYSLSCGPKPTHRSKTRLTGGNCRSPSLSGPLPLSSRLQRETHRGTPD
jgi:hypothetical protein